MKATRRILAALFLLAALSPAVLASGSTFDEVRSQLQQRSQSISQGVEAVRELQETQSKVSGFLQQARELQLQAMSDGSQRAALPQELKSFLDQNGLSYDKSSSSLDVNGWKTVIRALEEYQEELGTSVQNGMASIQDALGAFNSSTQDLTLNLIQPGSLTPVSWGQSLFSTDGSMSAAPVATSLLVGIVLGMGAMWLIQRARRKGKGS